MLNLGKIRIGKSMYLFYSGFKDPSTGRFATTGKRYFEFLRMKKNSDGVYEMLKHNTMNPFYIRTGRTVSRSLYYAQKPAVKAGLIGTATLAAGAGIYSLYKYVNNNNAKLSKDAPAGNIIPDTKTNVPIPGSKTAEFGKQEDKSSQPVEPENKTAAVPEVESKVAESAKPEDNTAQSAESENKAVAVTEVENKVAESAKPEDNPAQPAESENKAVECSKTEDKADQPAQDPDLVYVVKKNDNIWNINKARLKKSGGPVTNAKILALTLETIKMNPTTARNNGDLIYPGDVLILPKIDGD